jgi:predicted lipoprotein
MLKALPLLVVIGVAAVFCWSFPPFHIRSQKAIRAMQDRAQFNATAFVRQFWNEKLLPATARAADALEVRTMIIGSPKQIREKFGRTVGVSSSYFIFLRGSGRVIRVDGDNVGLTLTTDGSEADVVVPLGLVFGNAVRDGTGLLDSSSYPNAQEFNDISAALNSIVETNVLPQLQRIATVGKHIRFTGCVEVNDEDQDLKPLKLVPISVEPE